MEQEKSQVKVKNCKCRDCRIGIEKAIENGEEALQLAE
jgi:hypothetical protein